MLKGKLIEPPLRLRLCAAFLSVAVVLFSLLPLTGCGIRRTPDLERIFAAARVRQGKRPVIVIPGVLGSQLVNAKTGEVVWPSLFRSTEDDLRLPVSPDLEANTDDLKASHVLDVARVRGSTNSTLNTACGSLATGAQLLPPSRLRWRAEAGIGERYADPAMYTSPLAPMARAAPPIRCDRPPAPGCHGAARRSANGAPRRPFRRR